MSIGVQRNELGELGILKRSERADINAIRVQNEINENKKRASIQSISELPEEYAWMEEAHREFILHLYLFAGQDGLHKSEAKKWDKKHKDLLLILEARQYILWEHDQMGRLMYVKLTWKGEDAALLLLAVARFENNKSA